jgi:CheY-like chemotaxis protein
MTTILFCEDSPMIRKLIEVAMRSTPYRILFAADGLEGLRVLQAEKPDLLVSDLAMPEMDGIELYDRLQELPDLAHIPVVFLTASTQRNLITNARKRNPRAIIAKPFSPAGLRAELDQIVAGMAAAAGAGQ